MKKGMKIFLYLVMVIVVLGGLLLGGYYIKKSIDKETAPELPLNVTVNVEQTTVHKTGFLDSFTQIVKTVVWSGLFAFLAWLAFKILLSRPRGRMHSKKACEKKAFEELLDRNYPLQKVSLNQWAKQSFRFYGGHLERNPAWVFCFIRENVDTKGNPDEIANAMKVTAVVDQRTLEIMDERAGESFDDTLERERLKRIGETADVAFPVGIEKVDSLHELLQGGTLSLPINPGDEDGDEE